MAHWQRTAKPIGGVAPLGDAPDGVRRKPCGPRGHEGCERHEGYEVEGTTRHMSASGGTRAIVAAPPPTSRSRQRSSWRSRSAVRRRCSPRALLADSGNQARCWSAARRPSARRPRSTPSATAESATSTPSSSRSSCSRCSPSTRATRRSSTRTRSTTSYWPVGVLVFAIIAETFSFRTAIKESNVLRGRKSWKEFVRHAKAPSCPSLLGGPRRAGRSGPRPGRRRPGAAHRRRRVRRHRHDLHRRPARPDRGGPGHRDQVAAAR